MNLDTREVAKFDALAKNWWNPEGPFKTLHQINPLRLSFIEKKVSLEGKKVLDVGCGGGILTEALARAGAQASGIDGAASVIDIARSHAKDAELAIDYHCITVEEFAQTDPKTFDVITCMELLEHVPDPQSVIKSCRELLKPGGIIFFSTLNRTLKSYLLAIIGAEYVMKLLPKGTHDYQKFIRPSELVRWCRDEGFEHFEFEGVHYHPFTNTFSLNSNIDVNYLVSVR